MKINFGGKEIPVEQIYQLKIDGKRRECISFCNRQVSAMGAHESYYITIKFEDDERNLFEEAENYEISSEADNRFKNLLEELKSAGAYE